MFYMENNTCYCRPDYYDGDYAIVGCSEFVVDYDRFGIAYIRGHNDQTYILIDQPYKW